jgi:hypothetical protein
MSHVQIRLLLLMIGSLTRLILKPMILQVPDRDRQQLLLYDFVVRLSCQSATLSRLARLRAFLCFFSSPDTSLLYHELLHVLPIAFGLLINERD